MQSQKAKVESEVFSIKILTIKQLCSTVKIILIKTNSIFQPCTETAILLARLAQEASEGQVEDQDHQSL